VFALMIASSVIALLSADGFALSAVAWQDLALVVAGLLLLVLARLIVYRKRSEAEDDFRPHIPLIDFPTPLPPGQPPRPVGPPPRVVAQDGNERRARQQSAEPAVEVGEEVQSGPVRFYRPPEGTLQLLPGRLEIVSGKEGVEEIRFVKVPGKEPIVTFGRSAGEPHTHIELQSPTVSRRHAAMRFQKGAWHIANLSKTNPVVVRGKQLALNDPAIRLEDGDEVEMGEVTFRFRAR
jgi:hypothetical protein